MAMSFAFNIHPFSYSSDPIQFGRMEVHSCGGSHEYTVSFKTKDGWQTIRGTIAKNMPDGTVRSGHRNFLHLLQGILADIDLDALGENYVHVLAEIREMFGNPSLKAGDYKND